MQAQSYIHQRWMVRRVKDYLLHLNRLQGHQAYPSRQDRCPKRRSLHVLLQYRIPPSPHNLQLLTQITSPHTQKTESAVEDLQADSPLISPVRLVRRNRPLSISFKPSIFPCIAEGKQHPPSDATVATLIPLLPSLPRSSISTPSTQNEHCTCGCHHEPLLYSQPRASYVDAAIQTDPLPSPPRTSLRLDTPPSIAAVPAYSYTETTMDVIYDEVPDVNPFPMGSMMAFVSKPGYELGDSLRNDYDLTESYHEPGYKSRFGYWNDEYDANYAAW
jgi:hypothetical protein